jgi:hypothetical protein
MEPASSRLGAAADEIASPVRVTTGPTAIRRMPGQQVSDLERAARAMVSEDGSVSLPLAWALPVHCEPQFQVVETLGTGAGK